LTDDEYFNEIKKFSHFAVLRRIRHIPNVFLKKKNIQQKVLYPVLLQTKENINKRNGKILFSLCIKTRAVFPVMSR